MKIDRPISIAVILFVILILIIFFVMPEYRDFRSSQADLGKIEAEYNGKFAYYSEISKAFRDLQDHKESVDKIDSALPKNPPIADIVYFLQEKSREKGLIIRDLFLSKFSNSDSEGGIKEIVFSLNLAGTYSSLKSFLYSIEDSARLFEVNNISFGSSVSQESSGTTATGTQRPSQFQVEQTYSFQLEIKTHSY